MTTINPLSTVPKALRDELHETFGLVPSFVRTTTPDNAVYWWKGLRDFQMSDQTALSPKVKELIGLGVSSQIPCEYCVSFHTEAAKLNGATDQEIQEAIFMAGFTRLGSTILNGSQLDPATFNKELKQMIDHVRQAMAAAPSSKKPAVSLKSPARSPTAGREQEQTRKARK